MNYTTIFYFILFLGVCAYLSKSIDKISKHKKKKNNNTTEASEPINIKESYKSKYILTANEYKFYKVLKAITADKNLIICPKIGLKDLFEVTNKNNYMSAFGKIAQKHVDFTICDSSLHVLGAIELDDISHKEREESDRFKNELFKSAGIKLIRIKAYPDYTETYVKEHLIKSEILK